MAYQKLEGIRITPKGQTLSARFPSWPQSFAFGGWVYSANCDIGFTEGPTSIKLDIVLDKTQTAFDIKHEDLQCGTNALNEEQLYDINFNGVVFTDLILWEYTIDIQPDNKILRVTFKDYSVLLDKMYVGLIKRHGKTHVHYGAVSGEIPVACMDCALDGTVFTGNATIERELAFGAYVGMKGNQYDLFAAKPTHATETPSVIWESVRSDSVRRQSFTLDGGFVLLGTEEIAQEKCSTVTDIKYSFNELLCVLRKYGMDFRGAYPTGLYDGNENFRQNYVGTLREVLNNWGSDFATSFFCSGKTFWGIDLRNPVDVSSLTGLAIPNTTLGENFDLDSSNAGLMQSYTETHSLDGTYEQSVITSDVQPRRFDSQSKTLKRYVDIYPMHPLDFTAPNGNNVVNNLGTAAGNSRDRRLSVLTNRKFIDVDACMGLSKYSEDLRNIFCQWRIVTELNAVNTRFSNTVGDVIGQNKNIDANFKALGFVPLINVTDNDIKSEILLKYKKSSQDISLAPEYYKIFIGYYYPNKHREILSWERSCAEKMYKIGYLAGGLQSNYPFHPGDVLKDLSPRDGFYGENGTSLLRVEHQFEPSLDQYVDTFEAPYSDLILYDNVYLRSGYYIGNIQNEWGLSQEEFEEQLSIINTACEQSFAGQASYADFLNDEGLVRQSWSLGDFAPVFFDDIREFYDEFQQQLEDLSNNNPAAVDMVSVAATNIDGTLEPECRKLHICILTDVFSHPNIYISFNPNGVANNPQMEYQFQQQELRSERERQRRKTPNDCEISLLQELCDKQIIDSGLLYPTNDRYTCEVDPTGEYQEGFTEGTVNQLNSRVLSVNVVKNPIKSAPASYTPITDDGHLYVASIDEDIALNDRSTTIDIIYPISNQTYRGVLTSNVTLENRTPEVVEIYGGITNKRRNNVATIKVINNTIDPDIAPLLNPLSDRFVTYVNVIDGNQQEQLVSVSGYHNFVANLNNYRSLGATKKVSINLAGAPNMFGDFSEVINPLSGLVSFNISLGQDGLSTSLEFAERPPVLPTQEAILNKIKSRIR